MSDLIKRSDAWKAFTSKVDDICDLEEIDEILESVPTADRPQEWIPCSERLPEARESVLLAVNHKYGDWVGEGCYWETTDNHIIWKGYRWNATYWDDEIIAWMPLPKPWRGESDDRQDRNQP